MAAEKKVRKDEKRSRQLFMTWSTVASEVSVAQVDSGVCSGI